MSALRRLSGPITSEPPLAARYNLLGAYLAISLLKSAAGFQHSAVRLFEQIRPKLAYRLPIYDDHVIGLRFIQAADKNGGTDPGPERRGSLPAIDFALSRVHRGSPSAQR